MIKRPAEAQITAPNTHGALFSLIRSLPTPALPSLSSELPELEL